MGSTRSAASGSWQAGNFLSVTGAVSVVGTNAALFSITGVALMVGAAAANAEPEFKKYSDNLIDCQRYFQTMNFLYGAVNFGSIIVGSSDFPVQMRAAPTVFYRDYVATPNAVSTGGQNGVVVSGGAQSDKQGVSFNSGTNFGAVNWWGGAFTLDADF
jgi:hypothetical protein